MNILENKLKYKNKKGITLIALIITIIILLILAGISILSIKNSNLLKNAKLAKEISQNAQDDENLKLEQYGEIIDDYLRENDDSSNKISAEDVSFTPENSNWNVKNVKEALDYLYNY